jgi:hypothetical protein
MSNPQHERFKKKKVDQNAKRVKKNRQVLQSSVSGGAMRRTHDSVEITELKAEMEETQKEL